LDLTLNGPFGLSAGFKIVGSGNRPVMANYTKKNLRTDVENMAPKFDMPAEMEARFARGSLDGKTLGLSLMTLAPNFRIPFAHKHEGQEEVYVVVRGSGRIKVEDDVVEVGEWDAIRFDKNTMRNVEAGPDGIEFVAFGAGEDPRDAEMAPNWWSD
jgi:mannose-6-phosphate isomerase-like protein (cupin superfamily)